MWKASLAFLLLVLVVSLLLNPDVNIQGNGSPVVLGDLNYYKQTTEAPVATGWFLRLQSYLLTSTPMGAAIRRLLLNHNKVHTLRELSAQAPGLPPLYYPMHRLSGKQHNRHIEMAQRHPVQHYIQHGFSPPPPPPPPPSSSSSPPPPSQPVSRIEQFHQAYKEGSATPVQVVKKMLSSLLLLQPKYKIFVDYQEQDILAQARASEARYKARAHLSVFDGVPVAVKDMLPVKGYVSTYGSASNAANEPETEDDPLVARFRELGAIIIGTTTMTEGGVTPLGYCVAHKGPFNPYNTKYYSGGSSSGSAVAVALGVCPLAIGFDGGGSIRIPAALSGVVGLATTFGRLGYLTPLATTMIKGGPMTSTVADAALSYAAMADVPKDHFYSTLYDGGDRGVPPPHLYGFAPTTSNEQQTSSASASALLLSGKRVGVFQDHFDDSNPAVLEVCRNSVFRLQQLGAELVQIAIPNIGWWRLAHAMKISTEFAQTWDAKYSQNTELEANTRITVGLGRTMSALEVLAAERLRRYAFDYMHELFANNTLDAIVSPTLPMSAPVLSEAAQLDGESNTPLVVEMMKFIFLANFLGLPAITVPIGHDSSNQMPVGLQFVGDHWEDTALLTIVRAVEMDISATAAPGVLHKPEDFVDFLHSLN